MYLIKGKIYRDTPEKLAKSTYLKFIEHNKEGFCFEYAGGDNGYLQRENGFIVLSIHLLSRLYEPTPEELASL